MSLKQVAESVVSRHQHSRYKPTIRPIRDQGTDKGARLTEQLLRSHHEQNIKAEQSGRLVNRMARLLEVLPGGVIVLNGQGKVQQCNAAAVNMLGEPLHDEYWPEVIQRAFAPKSDNSPDIALLSCLMM